jgi:predicted TIM-barrel fold metal-dependent hydrolase
VLDQIGSERMLLFATDYPHWHHDEPAEALPPLPEGPARDAVLAGNARRLYRLEGSHGRG